jgi:hypothetical protein
MEVFERPTLAQVFRRFYARYRQSSDVTAEQRRAAWSIQVCRTPALGEDHYECEHCHQTHTVYHSCGNRHCPICQGSRSYAWLEGQQERLLPVPYFHVVFSVASELNLVMLYNRKLLFQEFFAQSSGTLQDFARDPRWLGAQLGFLGVLHTWGQTLVFHPHIHYIVPQGGIDAEGRWVSPKLKDQARFLFPIQAVSEVFRGRFLHRLEQLHAQGKLRFPDAAAESRFPDQLRLAASKPWQVYAQAPFAGPEPLLRYLSLYTHRAAISSGRLLECDDRSVSFAYKDYRQGGQTKTMRLGGEVFVGRFLQHVAPKGFRRIRHYGFLANASGREAVRQVQEQWLSRVLILLAMVGRLGPLLEKGSGAEPDPGDWTLVCPFCGQGPLRYLPKRLEWVRPDDTS